MGEEGMAFTGVWIPREIMLDDRLSSTDKILYAEIACFGAEGCYKKTEALIERLGVCKTTLQASLRRLVELGFIEEQKLNNGRILRKSTLGFPQVLHNPQPKNYAVGIKNTDPQPKKCAVAQPKKCAVHNKNTNKNTTILSKDNIGAEAQAVEKSEEKASYGNNDINEMFEYWKEKTNLPIISKVKLNRRACNTLIRRHGVEGCKGLIRLVAIAQEKPFTPSIGDFIELMEKYNSLIIWYKKERKNISALRQFKALSCDSKGKKVNSSTLEAAKALERELEGKSSNSDDSSRLTKEQLNALRDRAFKNL